MGHLQTHAPQQSPDHLVGAQKRRRRHIEAKRLGVFRFSTNFKFGGLLDRQIGELGTFQNLVDEGTKIRILFGALLRRKLEHFHEIADGGHIAWYVGILVICHRVREIVAAAGG
jgi:hypothetical protein